MAENITARLKQAKLIAKNDIADLVKKTYFDEKLINTSKKVISNKTRYDKVQNKLNDL